MLKKALLIFMAVLTIVGFVLLSNKIDSIPPLILHAGSTIAAESPIIIPFSDPMDILSVETSFSIDPPIEGTFTWEEDTTMIFQPKTHFKEKQKYYVTFQETAMTKQGVAIPRAYKHAFTVLPPLALEKTIPKDGEEMITKSNTFSVYFDRNLEKNDDESTFSQYFSIDPPIEGIWKKKPSYVVFTADQPFQKGEVFLVTIKKGILAHDGSTLSTDTVISFSTPAPKITSSIPEDTDTQWNPTNELSLHWNQQVDLDTLFPKLHITEENDEPESFFGTIIFDEFDNTIVTVIPSPELKEETTYILSIDSGVKSLFGSRTMEEDNTITFTTK